MNQKILDALLKLDINNDEHWTSDGLPRMDVLEGIVGDKSLTRQQVTAAKPGFSRAVAAQAQAQQEQQSQGSTEPSKETAPASAQPPSAKAPAATTPSEEENEGEVEDSEDSEVAEARKALAEAQAELDELTAERAKVEKAHVAKMQEVDKLTDALEALVGKETTGDAIQGYLARQRQNLAERAERMKEIRDSGVNIGEITRGLKSPLDAAMTRKTGHALGRPGG